MQLAETLYNCPVKGLTMCSRVEHLCVGAVSLCAVAAKIRVLCAPICAPTCYTAA